MESFLDMIFARPLRERVRAAVHACGALWRRKL
jgi:hypothetical protein